MVELEHVLQVVLAHPDESQVAVVELLTGLPAQEAGNFPPANEAVLQAEASVAKWLPGPNGSS